MSLQLSDLLSSQQSEGETNQSSEHDEPLGGNHGDSDSIFKGKRDSHTSGPFLKKRTLIPSATNAQNGQTKFMQDGHILDLQQLAEKQLAQVSAAKKPQQQSLHHLPSTAVGRLTSYNTRNPYDQQKPEAGSAAPKEASAQGPSINFYDRRASQGKNTEQQKKYFPGGEDSKENRNKVYFPENQPPNPANGAAMATIGHQRTLSGGSQGQAQNVSVINYNNAVINMNFRESGSSSITSGHN